MPAFPERGILSAVIPSISERCGQRSDTSEIAVIATTFAGQQRVHGVMKVVAPLGIEVVPTLFGGVQNRESFRSLSAIRWSLPAQSLRQIRRPRPEGLPKNDVRRNRTFRERHPAADASK